MQNAYSLVSRDDDELLEFCVAHDIAWVPFFPLGSAFAHLPKVTDEPAVIAAAERLGYSSSQVGLAWLLHRAPNILLIPGTADGAHLEANVATGKVVLDEKSLESLGEIPSRSGSVSLG